MQNTAAMASGRDERSDRAAYGLTDRRDLARRGVDVDVDEAADRGGLVCVALEQPDAVDDARRAELRDREPGLHVAGESELPQELALRLGDQANRVELADVNAGRVDQEAVDRGVEERVVDDVVDVPVDVLVRPPRRDGPQHRENRTQPGTVAQEAVSSS